MKAMGDNPVYFKSGIPSNFYTAPIVLRCPVTRKPRMFDSNERYFQVAKAAVSPLMDQEEIEAVALLMINGTSAEAKRLGRYSVKMTEQSLKAWNMKYAPLAMWTCNIEKYTRHAHCREWLLNTGTRKLVEHRPDPVWADGLDGKGKNLLGKILMLVRDVLR
jgi:hypothetical protein